MIEFNGWAIIRESFTEKGEDEELLNDIICKIQMKISELDCVNEIYSLKCLNGTYHLGIMVNHNHQNDNVIEFFKWISEISKGSYGVLYMLDDECIEIEIILKYGL
ncbi:Imm7 family immunity protein [Phocoenobacter skyensis]|uniref:Imm7 family immunity protein n=1 Tax=Phocoenobacter skyensis TaxID=97481 RepID=A0A1H7Y4Y6_9PAST|nr:Imm7 family immunity protein [Pasteurella skyensis]MDP8079944.1 Imm7 family immunity protein [Pasteurella skyensis]MDP8085840.1 Imm7 family immunity protein [Pasteurella skyensis]MDP8185716.1 Imm7 family immunity protein [Pasteurella skyensis]QLB22338.1 hypothetical protein A6B44_03625 [Pasteurella skyensis]SEM40944.1 Immunity protein 7 [Pasteurella skyensis]